MCVLVQLQHFTETSLELLTNSHLKAKLQILHCTGTCKTVFRHISNYMSGYKNKWCVQVDKVLIERKFCKSWQLYSTLEEKGPIRLS